MTAYLEALSYMDRLVEAELDADLDSAPFDAYEYPSADEMRAVDGWAQTRVRRLLRDGAPIHKMVSTGLASLAHALAMQQVYEYERGLVSRVGHGGWSVTTEDPKLWGEY